MLQLKSLVTTRLSVKLDLVYWEWVWRVTFELYLGFAWWEVWKLLCPCAHMFENKGGFMPKFQMISNYLLFGNILLFGSQVVGWVNYNVVKTSTRLQKLEFFLGWTPDFHQPIWLNPSTTLQVEPGVLLVLPMTQSALHFVWKKRKKYGSGY